MKNEKSQKLKKLIYTFFLSLSFFNFQIINFYKKYKNKNPKFIFKVLN